MQAKMPGKMRKLLGFSVNDARNGLPWCASVEYLFERHKLIMSNTKTARGTAPSIAGAPFSQQSYQVHILDKAMLNVKLADVGQFR
jgi:hypothetical protein